MTKKLMFAVGVLLTSLFNFSAQANGNTVVSLETSRAPNIAQDQIQIGDMVLDRESLSQPERLNPNISPIFDPNGIDPMGATHFIMGNPWTDGVIPVEFAGDIFDHEKDLFFDACREWENLANIKCVPRNNESQYVHVQKSGAGCWAEVGMGYWYTIGGRERTINLERPCWHKKTIMHEIGHTLSLIHEHQRDDRNDYIKINWSKIPYGSMMQFIRLAWSTEHSTYDFESIMHYPSYAFAARITDETITPKSGYEKYRTTMGRTAVLSKGDQKTAIALYGERRK